MRAHKHVLSEHRHFNICIFALVHVPAKYDSSQVPLSFVFVWGMIRLCNFFFKVFFLYFFVFCIFKLFFPKLYFIKKRQTKYKKKKSFPVLLVESFLLIKGDGQLDRHTDKSVGLSTQTTDVKKKWNSFFYVTLHAWSKVTTAVFFIFYTEQF